MSRQRDENGHEYVSLREFYGEMTKIKVLLAVNTAAVAWAITGHPAAGGVVGVVTGAIGLLR